MSRSVRLLALTAVLCHGQAPAAAPAMQTGPLPSWETSASGPLRPLPAGCRLLEYVESTGAQYVDTGIAPGANTLDYEIAFSHSAASIKGGFGCRQTSSAYTTGSYVVFLRSNSGSEARIDIANNGAARYVVAAAGTMHTFRYVAAERTLYADGIAYTANSKTVCEYNFILGGINTAGTAAAGAPIKIYSASFYQSGVLVRDYLPVLDAAGVAGLWDRVSGEIHYSTTATPLVAGPPLVDPDADTPSLLPRSRNWYAPWLLATNPPASSAPDDAFAFDALVLPEGLYCTRRSASEFVVAEHPMIEAMVQRYRTGLAPTNLPVNIDHASTNVVGRVTRLWHVAGSGLWVRLEVPKAACAGKPFLSAEVLCLRATASDAWGSWGLFELPWTLTGVALTADPALSGTRYRLLDYVPSATGTYPDPRTVNDTWTPHR